MAISGGLWRGGFSILRVIGALTVVVIVLQVLVMMIEGNNAQRQFTKVAAQVAMPAPAGVSPALKKPTMVRGTVVDGKVVLDGSPQRPEGTRVEVAIPAPPAQAPSAKDQSISK